MPISIANVEALIDRELTRIAQPDLVARIKELLVPVRSEPVGWDYGEPVRPIPAGLSLTTQRQIWHSPILSMDLGPHTRGACSGMARINQWAWTVLGIFRLRTSFGSPLLGTATIPLAMRSGNAA